MPFLNRCLSGQPISMIDCAETRYNSLLRQRRTVLRELHPNASRLRSSSAYLQIEVNFPSLMTFMIARRCWSTIIEYRCRYEHKCRPSDLDGLTGMCASPALRFFVSLLMSMTDAKSLRMILNHGLIFEI